MATDVNLREQQAIEAVEQMVSRALLSDDDPSTVARKLEESGWEPEAAAEMVDQINHRIIAAQEREKFTPGSLIPAALGGMTAALVGGGIWGAIEIATHFEIGYIAWGVGALAGFGVVLAANGQRGLPLQLVAMFASMLGILVGKYLFFSHLIVTAVQAKTHISMSHYSLYLVGRFFVRLPEMLTPHDILWVVLALGTAAKITKATQTQMPPVKMPAEQMSSQQASPEQMPTEPVTPPDEAEESKPASCLQELSTTT